MRKYTRGEFKKLPKGTIFSYIGDKEVLCEGLYRKTSDDMANDWFQSDLIGYASMGDVDEFAQRDNSEDFRIDYEGGYRDACFDDDSVDYYIVWDREDVLRLSEYLLNVLKTTYGV